LVFSVTETRPRWFAFFFFSIFSWRTALLRAHLAHLLFADRRSGDGFETRRANDHHAGKPRQKDGPQAAFCWRNSIGSEAENLPASEQSTHHAAEQPVV